MSNIYPENSGGALPQSSSAGQDSLKSQATDAREKLADAGATVRGEAAHFADNLRETVASTVDEKKEEITDALAVFADAIRTAGDELNGKDQSFAGRLAGQAADGLQVLSRNLAGKTPEAMLDSARELGRNNPTALLFGAVLAGVAVGRFARSSAHHQAGGSNLTTAALGRDTPADTTPEAPLSTPSHGGAFDAPASASDLENSHGRS